MICSRCGENNPESYRFCGMCGGALQTAKAGNGSTRTEAKPEPVRAAASSGRPGNMAFSRAETRPDFEELRPAGRPTVGGPTITIKEQPIEPISGPSLLGLNQPSVDVLRDRAFSSVDTYFQPDERRPAWGRIFFTLLILVGLGAVAWWRYNNFGRPGEHGKPAALTAMNKTAEPGAPVPQISTEPQNPPSTANDEAKITPPTGNAAPAGKPGDATKPEEKDLPPTGAGANSPAATDSAAANPASAATTPAAEPAKPANAAEPSRTTAKPTSPAKAANQPAAESDDDTADNTPVKSARAAAVPQGDALFRKGESYLYGRGAAKNCDQAIKYLKAASAQSHAKARSTFGTMYATGHCVPRDLPTSYRWFALALQADPNNSILEKDLSAIWNQMTPPERQLATKLRQ